MARLAAIGGSDGVQRQPPAVDDTRQSAAVRTLTHGLHGAAAAHPLTPTTQRSYAACLLSARSSPLQARGSAATVHRHIRPRVQPHAHAAVEPQQ